MNLLIEPGIEPLVSALNGLEYVQTVYSCEGHFDRQPDKRFLPTAYVTFSVTDLQDFVTLYEILVEIDRSENGTNLRLTYDCVLGRFTLSVWPEEDRIDAAKKRSVIDAALACLSDEISQIARLSSSPKQCDDGKDAGYPCNEPVPPCALVMPAREPTCPFA